MATGIFAFADYLEQARRLATLLDVPFKPIDVHRFPDGESLIRVTDVTDTAIVYRSLDNPNAKLVELLLASSALRDNGATHVVLVVPYLAYMRQDMAFEPGEAVSQKVIGMLLARQFDAVIAIDPHLHRIASLDEVMPGITALSVSAAPVLSAALDNGSAPVLIGPDSESRQWVEAIAAPLGLDVLVGTKQRHGDRDVSVTIESIHKVEGRTAVLVDDVISSGETLVQAARLLRDAGASDIEALATHCLASERDLARMRDAGISRVRSTDSVVGPTGCIACAPLLADALKSGGYSQ